MNNKRGYILIIVLLMLAVTTTLVIHFSTTVYGYAAAANNFGEAERMSLLLKSAYLITAEKALDLSSQLSFTDQREIAHEEKIGDTVVGLVAGDNNSRFNVNSLVFRNGRLNETGLNIFKRLLRQLGIDEEYAYRLADYIDPDRIPGVPNGETYAKNHFLYCLSELEYIFPEEAAERLRPYLTVFGDGTININTADVMLLKSLHPDMTESLAERLEHLRNDKPFETMGELLKVPGMEKIGIDISDLARVKSNSFNLTIRAEHNDLAASAEAGFDLSEGRVALKYWREQ